MSTYPGQKNTADEIINLGRKAFAVSVDVSNQSQVNDMVKAAIAELGRIDILVNTAGGTSGAGPLHQAQEDKWERDININFLGSMYCAKAVLPGMMERKYGKIVISLPAWRSTGCLAPVHMPGLKQR